MRIAQCLWIRAVVGAASALCFSACVGIAADSLDSFIGTQFTNPDKTQPYRNPKTKSLYYRTYGDIYKEEAEGTGRRVYINYFRHCRYSFFIDRDDIIRSWRDEGGPVHMRSCKYG